MLMMGEEIKTNDPLQAAYRQILPPEALAFFTKLQQTFNPMRLELLKARKARQEELDNGALPTFLPDTAPIRESEWQIAPTPSDLQKRWVEITGPADRKMMINALNSGADVFMADFEDSLSPTWENILQGQVNLMDAVRRRIKFKNPDGKIYTLNEKIATLLVRPRGWHLDEPRLLIDGEPVSASLFDFGLYFFHNAHELIKRGTGPYFYLPKLESHREARLWNDVFNMAQDLLGIPRGTIRATVLIETILAAFEMDEILYELRDHAAGLNAGRWDYIFSVIKKFSGRRDFVLPDRSQVVMTVPFMHAYTELLIRTCHRRGAHAIGGMAAFIPSRRDEEVNELALNKVREDKLRESSAGHDGTWVAHPDLVAHARKIFEERLGEQPHQKNILRKDVNVKEKNLLDFRIPGGRVTETGLRTNINVALQYLNSWLNGNGAAAIHNLMEDVATAEISRAQLWQWLHHKAVLEDGRTVTPDLYRQIRDEEMQRLLSQEESRYHDAVGILDGLVLSDDFVAFLTIPAMKYI
jgi:malate synthase